MDNESDTCPGRAKARASFGHECEKVVRIHRVVALDAICLSNLAVFDIRWVANYDVETAPLQDAVELNEPVEGLMGRPLHGKRGFVVRFDAILPSEIAIQFVAQFG